MKRTINGEAASEPRFRKAPDFSRVATLSNSRAAAAAEGGCEVGEALEDTALKGLGFSPAEKQLRGEAALAAEVRSSRQDGPRHPLAEALQSKSNPSPNNSLRKRIKNAFSLLLSTLREIFDESAYARFLARRQIATSPKAYADFLRETQAHCERRPRCC
jgi:hypothetical protein